MTLVHLCQTGLNNLFPQGNGTSDQGCNEVGCSNTAANGESLVLLCPYFSLEDLARNAT